MICYICTSELSVRDLSKTDIDDLRGERYIYSTAWICQECAKKTTVYEIMSYLDWQVD